MSDEIITLDENNLTYRHIKVIDSKPKVEVFRKIAVLVRERFLRHKVGVGMTVKFNHWYIHCWHPQTDLVYSPEFNSSDFVALGDEQALVDMLEEEIKDAFELGEVVYFGGDTRG